MKIALGVEYQGRRYLGWQRQNDAPTVQEILETALAEIAGSTRCGGLRRPHRPRRACHSAGCPL